MMSRTHRPRSDSAPTPAHALPPARPLMPARTLPPALSSGQALDGETQAGMSARFGHDFSSVRIHTDSRAGESALAAGANAYALGTDIVFGAGRYRPGSSGTQRLLAHELTHVVQQSRFGPGDPARVSQRSDDSEREADALAADVAAGRDAHVRAAPGAAVARDGFMDMFSKTVDDWKFSPMAPKTSTDGTHDQVPGQWQANDRARQQAGDADAAKSAGTTDPRPKWWTGPPFVAPSLKPSAPGPTGPGLGPVAPITPPTPHGPVAPLPGFKPWTPPSLTPSPSDAGPAPGAGPQLTPPVYTPLPAYQPPLLGSDLPPLALAPPAAAPG